MVFDVAPANDGVCRAVKVGSLSLPWEQTASPEGFSVEILSRPSEAKLVYQPGNGNDHVDQRRGPARQRLEESPMRALPHKISRARVEAESIPRDDEPVTGGVSAELFSQELADPGGGADAAVGKDVQQDPGLVSAVVAGGCYCCCC